MWPRLNRPQVPTPLDFRYRSRVLSLFGELDDANDGEKWEEAGTVWTLAASSGPSPRDGHAMAYDRHMNRAARGEGSEPRRFLVALDGQSPSPVPIRSGAFSAIGFTNARAVIAIDIPIAIIVAAIAALIRRVLAWRGLVPCEIKRETRWVMILPGFLGGVEPPISGGIIGHDGELEIWVRIPTAFVPLELEIVG